MKMVIDIFRHLIVISALPFMNCNTVLPTELTKTDIPPDVSPKVRGLIELTFAEDLRQRVGAAKELGAMHEQAAAAVPFLMRLADDKDLNDEGFYYYYSRDALVAIGEPALGACITAAMDAARGPAPSDRYWDDRAIQCLGHFKSRRALDAILELLKSPNPQVLESVLLSFKNCNDTRFTTPLLNIVEQGRGRIRVTATYRFETLRDPRAVEPLLRAMRAYGPWSDSYQLDLARATATALGGQGDSRAVPILIKAVKESDSRWLRSDAAIAIAKIGDSVGFNWLANTLLDNKLSIPIRIAAAEGLGQFQKSVAKPQPDKTSESRVLALLTDVLKDDEEPIDLRSAVARAIGSLGSPSAVKTLCQIADSHVHDDLGFWASICAVELSHGKVRNLSVAQAINNYRLDPEASRFDDHRRKRIALAKLTVGSSEK